MTVNMMETLVVWNFHTPLSNWKPYVNDKFSNCVVNTNTTAPSHTSQYGLKHKLQNKFVPTTNRVVLMMVNKCYWRKYQTDFLTSKWQPFWKCQNIKQNFNLTSNMRRSYQIMPEKAFCVVMSSMTSQGDLKVALYSCSGEVGLGSKLQGPAWWSRFEGLWMGAVQPCWAGW